MKALRSYIRGNWHEAQSGLVPLVNPSTEETIAQAGSAGIDFEAVLDYAREKGGPALRAMTFAQRGALLKEMSKVLRDHRDELLALSTLNTRTTTPPRPLPPHRGPRHHHRRRLLRRRRRLGHPRLLLRARQGAGRPHLPRRGGGGAARQDRGVLRPAHPGAAPRCRGPHQRLQLPRLGIRRES